MVTSKMTNLMESACTLGSVARSIGEIGKRENCMDMVSSYGLTTCHIEDSTRMIIGMV